MVFTGKKLNGTNIYTVYKYEYLSFDRYSPTTMVKYLLETSSVHSYLCTVKIGPGLASTLFLITNHSHRPIP